jgi:hypothetical protein
MTSFCRRGFAPSVQELAGELGITVDATVAVLRRLHDDHGVVLHPHSDAIWIAHPFSGSPTAIWVEAEGRGWWAPCPWCAMGVVILAAPRRAIVHLRLGGERDEALVVVDDGRVASEDLLVHFPIPARDAWANVVHFCASVLPFRREADVDGWCARHAFPRGDLQPMTKVLELARTWYGRHLDVEWRKWTVHEARAIFERLGLRGDAWQLPEATSTF